MATRWALTIQFAIAANAASSWVWIQFRLLDDVTLGGEARKVAHDIEVVTELEITVGLVLNQSKCEIYASDSSRSQTAPFL